MARMPDFEMPEEPGVDASPQPSDEPRRAVPGEGLAASADPATGPAVDAAGHGAELRSPWRRIRTPLVAFVAGIVVASGCIVGVQAAQERAAQAEIEGLVDAYVAVVASTDRATAAPSVSLDGSIASSSLLLAGVAPEAAPEVSCDAPRIGADVATVDCTVRVERRDETARIVLERPRESWRIVDGLEVPVLLQPGTVQVETVGDVTVEASIARGQQAVWMLPGTYDVTVRTPPQLVVEQLDGLVVSATDGAVRWRGGTSMQLDADVEASALAFVRACAAGASDGCPALQQRDPAEPFEVFDVVGPLSADDPHAATFEVSIRRPIEQPAEFVVVTVRVDFGDDLDRYDVTAG